MRRHKSFLRKCAAALAAPFALALLLSAPSVLAQPAGAQARPAERVTPSGLPVPRYVTLKFDKVNARAGPGNDHRLLWVYRIRGLPVQVVAETSEWRRICDPEGGLAWVHRRTTDGRRNVINAAPQPLALHRKPRRDTAVSAFLNVRAMAALERCEGGWCRLKVAGEKGWAPESRLWGVAAPPQCR